MGHENYNEAGKMSKTDRLILFSALEDNVTVWKEVYKACNDTGYSPEVLQNMIEDAAEDVPQSLQRIGEILITLQQPAIDKETAKEKVEELISLVTL